MKIRPWLACASILVVLTNALAQDQASVQGGASANTQGTAELNANLTKPLDAKKNKPGDEVVATVTQDVKSNGKVVIPRGSKLIGHVTEAKASAAADSSSRLGVVFDRAVLKNGNEVPLNATIQALAAAKVSEFEPSSGPTHSRPNGGGLVGGVSSTAGSTLGGATSVGGAATGTVGSTVRGTTYASAGALGGLNAAGNISSGSRGVFDMKGLNIQSATTGTAQGSVITSSTRTVRLDAGTQMLLTINAL